MCICCHTLASCLHQPIATTIESANPAAAPRGMTTKDKKIELMVLTSTSYVAAHIAPCISSVVICLTQVELQMVLISTVSTSILSSVVAILVASKRRPQRPRSPRPSPPLHLRTAATKQLAAQVGK